jgi:LysM repeat protein
MLKRQSTVPRECEGTPSRSLARTCVGACLALAVFAAPSFAHTYRTEHGDSLEWIARQNGLSAESLARANGLPVDAPLQVGVDIEVPAAPAPPVTAADRAAPVPWVVPVTGPQGTAFLTPAAAQSLEALRRKSVDELGVDLYPEGSLSGFRTYAQQLGLYRKAQTGVGAEAAPPGTSQHERGIALDLAEPAMRDAVDRFGGEFGWRKVDAPGEWWHVSYVGR